MRVAAVDCGTNTIRLLVLDEDGVTLLRTSRIVRLGEGVDAGGRLGDAALDRTLRAVDEYAGLLTDLGGVDRLRFCATSAVRDVTDASSLADGVRGRLGVDLEVLTGAEEAALTFAGAVGGLRVPSSDPVLVVDIGGGSTELVLGGRGPGAPVGTSLDVGAVRLTERHVRHDPPTPDELAAIIADVDGALDAVVERAVDLAAAATVVGVAGTVLTLAAGLTGARDLAAADQAVLDVAEVRSLVARLVSMSTAERVATGWIDPGRADLLPAGGLVLDRVLRRTGCTTLVASVADVLDGSARALLRDRQGD